MRRKEIKDKQLIWDYLEWVLEIEPEIGLSLFIERQRGQELSKSSMSSSGERDKNQQEQVGVVNDLEHEEILRYLEGIENKLIPNQEESLESQKEEVWSNVFAYRERYLEFVVNLGENVDKYQTLLAELYIDTLFKIQDKDSKDDGILFPNIIVPRRKKLLTFLEEKQNYNPEALLEKVMGSWMFDEKIILLVKKKMYDEAIKIYVDSLQFQEAEDFCRKWP